MCDLNIPAIGLALDDGIGPNNVALDPILYLNSEIIMGYQNKGWFLSQGLCSTFELKL